MRFPGGFHAGTIMHGVGIALHGQGTRDTDALDEAEDAPAPADVSQRVSVIIPAYNEADVISDTVSAALAIAGVSEVIVVDDGSSDGTAEAAKSAGAHRVITVPSNLGKGGALNAALPHATGEVLLLLDADLGPSAVEGSRLLEAVLRREADMAIALFNPKSAIRNPQSKVGTLSARSGGFGLVVKCARTGIWLLTRKRMKSPLAGPRAIKRGIVERAGGFASRFGVEVGLTIDALRMGYRIAEVPVGMVHRPSGRSLKGFMHRARQLVDVLAILGRKALRL